MDPNPTDDGAPVVVAVTRTGGFAGMRRRWQARVAGDEEPEWRALIARCPWDAAPRPTTGADRFMWTIDARCDGGDTRTATVADEELTGPWRELVDAVRTRGKAPAD